MKKARIFLAALLFFSTAALTSGNVQEVQAYSWEELKDSFETCYSSKAGTKVTISGYHSKLGDSADLTTMKVAYCPVDNHSLEAAAAVWDIESKDWHPWSVIEPTLALSKSVTYESDISEGIYDIVVFDAAGNEKGTADSSRELVNKVVVNYQFVSIDDGYVYAYFTEDELPTGITADESYCPVLYDVDQQTALTAYDDFVIYKETEGYKAGKSIYYYRLNVLDSSRIDTSADSGETAYFKAMNSEVFPSAMNENGMGRATINKRDSLWKDTENPFDNKDTQTPDNTPSNDTADSASLTGKSRFVALLYENVLERSATESEIANWVQELENGKSGADTASGFIFSEEFTNKNLSNSEYVERLYQSMMGRASDEGGKSDWVAHLENGVSRLYVFKQFVNSQEFANLCEEYAIVQGDAELSEARDMNYDVTRFVARNYKEFLGRDYDEAGMNDWTSRINRHEQTMQEIASGFVFSQECTDKNLSDEAYVQMLYRGCFDRTGDADGVADWVSKLAEGSYNREEVFLGFANSQEFANMVSNYGL